MSHRLRTATLRAQLNPAALASAVGVDVKTVNRWLAGRLPHQRTRLAVADTLGETEAALWLKATDLRVGQWLRTSAGTLVQVAAVQRWT
jgi:transcriptional regulator with XRE-family HTH domain